MYDCRRRVPDEWWQRPVGRRAWKNPILRSGAAHGLAWRQLVLDCRSGVVTWSLAVFSEVSYLVCVLYGLIVPEALHMAQFLEIALPGFWWPTTAGFLIGEVESFFYGAYAGLVLTPIYNFFQKRWGA